MAGRGPAPKETRSRTRDQKKRESEQTVVVEDDEVRGPELPEGIDWPDATLEWWDTWRKSPQAQTFTDTDWSFLLDTAVLHMRFWDGDNKVAGELRLRAAKFGATPEDRARLKLSVGQPQPGSTGSAPASTEQPKRGPAPRTKRQTANRKTRVLGVVQGGAASG